MYIKKKCLNNSIALTQTFFNQLFIFIWLINITLIVDSFFNLFFTKNHVCITKSWESYSNNYFYTVVIYQSFRQNSSYKLIINLKSVFILN